MAMKKVLDLCEKQGFIKRLITEGVANNELLKLGPAGAVLQENLKTEWFYSMVINRDNSVFFSKDSFVDTFDYAKQICLERLPFGVAEVIDDKNQNNDNDKLFLRTTMFVSPSSAIEFFHQWQRERKTWWRRFSACPSRYDLTEIQINGSGNQSVDIKTEYPWGVHVIESLKVSNEIHGELDSERLRTKDGRKKVQAHHVVSDISLSSMLLNTLCDAYDEPLFQEETRPLLRFHRKLAPYKISFAIVTSAESAVTEELGQLALYLCRQLRKNHISCLLLPSAIKNTLEAQWRQNDQLGVPYTVVLNSTTLKNGIALLRSRETTLKEQVHISNLSKYVQQLFKNY